MSLWVIENRMEIEFAPLQDFHKFQLLQGNALFCSPLFLNIFGFNKIISYL